MHAGRPRRRDRAQGTEFGCQTGSSEVATHRPVVTLTRGSGDYDLERRVVARKHSQGTAVPGAELRIVDPTTSERLRESAAAVSKGKYLQIKARTSAIHLLLHVGGRKKPSSFPRLVFNAHTFFAKTAWAGLSQSEDSLCIRRRVGVTRVASGA